MNISLSDSNTWTKFKIIHLARQNCSTNPNSLDFQPKLNSTFTQGESSRLVRVFSPHEKIFPNSLPNSFLVVAHREYGLHSKSAKLQTTLTFNWQWPTTPKYFSHVSIQLPTCQRQLKSLIPVITRHNHKLPHIEFQFSHELDI